MSVPTDDRPPRNHVGTVSLAGAVAGAVACHLVPHVTAIPADAAWLRLVAAGFEAALVGGLADWFAVTALFRHPLGLPIPHTALIPTRRAKLVEGIVGMVERDWLSPAVIAQRLARFTPSAFVAEWVADDRHRERLAAPIRDAIRAAARVLDEPEVARFLERALRDQLRALPVDAGLGRALAAVATSRELDAALATGAASLANLAARPRTAGQLAWWIDRSARHLRERGRIVVPFLLRRRRVQRQLVEAACDWAATELRAAADGRDHPLRTLVRDALARFADRLIAGDVDATAQAGRVHEALVESLEAGPLVASTLARLRERIDRDLADPASDLATLLDRRLATGVLGWLRDEAHAARFDDWIRGTVNDLVRRHHHQIGVTVRENLEALDTATLVRQVETRVGADLQYIRLNGAVVGGLIGMLIAATRLVAGAP